LFIYLYSFCFYISGGTEEHQRQKAQATVYYHGMVYLVIPSRLVSYCDGNAKDDKGELQCRWKFGSWTHNGLKINLTNSRPPDVSNYEANSIVSVVKVDSTRNEIYYDCCSEPYPDITYKLTLKRKP